MDKIKTMVIDDTVVYRRLMSDIINGSTDLELTATASSGRIALNKMKNSLPELVLCDIHMPEMDGVETVKKIKSEYPDIMVAVMSGISSRNADITVKALESGAIDFIKKPEGDSKDDNMELLKQDIRKVVRVVRVRRNTEGIRRKPDKKDESPIKEEDKAKKSSIPSKFAVVAVGVSTGGPDALNSFIPLLPKDFPVPVLLVQHMPENFTKSLAESLERKSSIRVVEASDNEKIEKGMVYLAPGGKHMTVKNDGFGDVLVSLNESPPVNSCRPSVDVLFRSVASVYGENGIISVILTGMGNDGKNGVSVIKRKGAYSITQSAETCVVYGMPRAVDEAGISDISLPLVEIAGEIVKKLK